MDRLTLEKNTRYLGIILTLFFIIDRIQSYTAFIQGYKDQNPIMQFLKVEYGIALSLLITSLFFCIGLYVLFISEPNEKLMKSKIFYILIIGSRILVTTVYFFQVIINALALGGLL